MQCVLWAAVVKAIFDQTRRGSGVPNRLTTEHDVAMRLIFGTEMRVALKVHHVVQRTGLKESFTGGNSSGPEVVAGMPRPTLYSFGNG